MSALPSRLLIALMAAGLAGTAAHAEDKAPSIDLTTLTCGEYISTIRQGHEDEMFRLAAWLDGYMASISADTKLNWSDIKKFSEELTVYCRKNGNSVLMDAARNAGIL